MFITWNGGTWARPATCSSFTSRRQLSGLGDVHVAGRLVRDRTGHAAEHPAQPLHPDVAHHNEAGVDPFGLGHQRVLGFAEHGSETGPQPLRAQLRRDITGNLFGLFRLVDEPLVVADLHDLGRIGLVCGNHAELGAHGRRELRRRARRLHGGFAAVYSYDDDSGHRATPSSTSSSGHTWAVSHQLTRPGADPPSAADRRRGYQSTNSDWVSMNSQSSSGSVASFRSGPPAS